MNKKSIAIAMELARSAVDALPAPSIRVETRGGTLVAMGLGPTCMRSVYIERPCDAPVTNCRYIHGGWGAGVWVPHPPRPRSFSVWAIDIEYYPPFVPVQDTRKERRFGGHWTGKTLDEALAWVKVCLRNIP